MWDRIRLNPYSLVIFIGILLQIHGDFINRSTSITGKGAWAYSTEIVIRCFSGDSFVRLSNEEKKPIHSLQAGDRLLTLDGSQVISTEMIMMLDQHRSQETEFYTIKTKLGPTISLTAFHLIVILSSDGTIDYIPARDVRLGDHFSVYFNGHIQWSQVINITREWKSAWFAPLTMDGTLLVNDIFVSCFASVRHHLWAQGFFTPFRLYYRFFRLISNDPPYRNAPDQEIPWFLALIYHLTRHSLLKEYFLL